MWEEAGDVTGITRSADRRHETRQRDSTWNSTDRPSEMGWGDMECVRTHRPDTSRVKPELRISFPPHWDPLVYSVCLDGAFVTPDGIRVHGRHSPKRRGYQLTLRCGQSHLTVVGWLADWNWMGIDPPEKCQINCVWDPSSVESRFF